VWKVSFREKNWTRFGERYKKVAGFDIASVNEKAKKTAKINGYGPQKTVVHEAEGMGKLMEKVETGVELSSDDVHNVGPEKFQT